VLLCCWLLLSAAVLAASDDDFYQRLYQRGMTHFAAADYAAAFTELRSAAFGFVERVEQFEIAQSYACVAAHRLGHVGDARDSLIRIVTAEKVQPRYRSLNLPDDLRAEVNGVARNLLTEQEAALLGVGAAAKPENALPAPATKPSEALTPHDGGPDANVPQPAPQPVTPAPVPQPKKPVAKSAPQPKSPVPQPVTPTPQPVVPAPQPQAPAPKPQPAVGNADSSLADAQRAIDSGDIDRARSIYTELSTAPSLPHTVALGVAEGLYRVRDFADAAKTFARAGTIGRGEEGYHYYYAVALYETGRYGNAKQELAAALPYIAVTPDVTRYRAKIEGAIE
jgi:tetratricopeptide (TPR) repeat protein